MEIDLIPEQPIDDDEFRNSVKQGIAAANRGEFVEHAEVWANVQAILES